MYSKDLFKNQIVLVTGGRSGIGFGIAKQFLELGAKVFICSRKEEPLKAAAAELSKIGEVQYGACDIRKVDQIKAMAANIKEVYGRLDILINNAGGQFPAPAELISENGWAAVINNNLNGTFYMSQVMAQEFFIPQNHGVIVNIIANMLRGFPGMAHTGAARAGVDNLTKTLGQEWATYGIRINAIAPGTIESSGLDQYPPAVQEQFAAGRQQNLMKRFGTVEDISNAVMFYASPLSSYISGTTLYVDGLEHLADNRMGLLNTLRSMIN
jgi:NAD(P)-dependent dehydrogenase (short-subunit alcohol dehydrogenase family)